MQPSTVSKIDLLTLLERLYPESSKNTLKKWIKAKRVHVNGAMIEDQQALVLENAEITLGAKKEFCHYDLQVLYEDQDLVVIYKPNGLLSVATDNEAFRTAHDYLKRRSPNKRVFPVHRLDKDTSGVMVFAYTQDAKAHLKDQFEAHTIHREYRAILAGHLEEKQGKWEGFLIEDANYKMHECHEKEGAQLAITFYEVLQETRRLSLVKFVLKTGKKNQIRVQAAQRGHPVLGDCKYGNEDDTFPRLALHAMVLEFVHPKKDKKLSFSYPLPKELSKLFASKS
jgi:23S rRNA pseudouridine1911/1915/1917 synthase